MFTSSDVSSSGVRTYRRATRSTWSIVALTGVAVLALGACTSGTDHAGGGGNAAPADNQSSSSPSDQPVTQPSDSGAPMTSAAPKPMQLAATPNASKNVNPTHPITVTATNGTLRKVKLVNDEGKQVHGAFSADHRSWHATEVLGYSKTYRLVGKASQAADSPVKKIKRKFTTLTPDTLTLPYLDDIYGSPLKNHASYGVGMVPVVHFDEPISNKAAAERTLSVTTSPHVDGSWYWADDQNVHWRPRNFYKSGTKVTIAANVYGKKVSPGLYGQSDEKVSFKIGRKQITVAKDTAPASVNKVRTFRNGHMVHVMNTSMGEHSGETVNGSYINFYTLDGTYTVLGFENPAHMCSDTYGLPANAPGGYDCEDIPWSTKISTDGIYLHELDSTQWAQDGGEDVSHGCLNLIGPNAEWFYEHSLVGDPVIIRGAKGAPTLQLWQGGDWTMSWKQWQKGSALS